MSCAHICSKLRTHSSKRDARHLLSCSSGGRS
jgi:hypothetical protein